MLPIKKYFVSAIIAGIIASVFPFKSQAQIMPVQGEKVNIDSIKRTFADTHYYFGLYKDNYFIFGPSLRRPDRSNTNVKFQISIAQKLTKNTLPWGTYLYLYYTQKVFWNVLEESMPMTDLNFNPGIGLAKPVFLKNRFVGTMSLMIEHESNGRDGLASRSWNKVSLSGSVMVDPNFIVYGKFWIPIVDGENNKDILKYSGIYQIGWQILSRGRKWSTTVNLVKRKNWNPIAYNLTLELAYRLRSDQNQFLFAQFYTGYGENLLEYNHYHTQLRVGIVIKPTLFSEY